MGLRRSQRVPIMLGMSVIFILVIALYNYNHSNTLANAKSWISIDGDNYGRWFRTSENPSAIEEVYNPLVSTNEETRIPLTPTHSDPSSKQMAHVHGFTVLDRLYLKGGTLYVVTNNPNFTPRNLILAKPLPKLGHGLDEDYAPTDEDMTYISPSQAREVLGEYAMRLDGLSFLSWDPAQFMNHFYHFWGEIILGSWRVYSSLGLQSPKSTSSLPLPSRIILPFIPANEWRDRADVDGPLMRAAFPQASIARADYWSDLKKLNTTFVFERAIITSRYVAHKHPWGGRWFKMIAGTMNVTAPDHYWEPVRRSMVRNMLGYIPAIDSNGRVSLSSMVPSPKPPTSADLGSLGWSLPVVTYISRQGAGRRLRNEDHQVLVESLKQLEKDGICTLQIPMMERLSLQAQVALIAKSTVLVGVHGNGLTHQLIMPPSLRSATFEIMDPPSYTFDYEILARNMGHKHYAVNNDTLITFPRGKTHEGVHFTKGFHGEAIPVYGPVVADMIRRRLTQPISDVED